MTARSNQPRAVDLGRGKWRGILEACGIPSHVLDGKPHPCPRSGEGKDRFCFKDRNGSGNYFCHCDERAREGKAGAIGLLMCAKGLSFQDACAEVERHAGVAPVDRPRQQVDHTGQIGRIARAVRPVGDDVVGYLASRGLIVPPHVREASLPYWEDRTKIGTYSALVARITAPDGTRRGYHVTYLQGQRKASVSAPRKLIGDQKGGAVIRLFPAAEQIGLAEGIETAIAAHQIWDLPVWSAISAIGMEQFVPPAGIKSVLIFGDNDAGFAGQVAAYRCAQRLRRAGVEVSVILPPRTGQDWNDVLIEQKQGMAA